jgi:hypothetical protein
MSAERRRLNREVSSLWEKWFPDDLEFASFASAFANPNSIFGKHEKNVVRDAYNKIEPYISVFEQCILYLFAKTLWIGRRVEEDRNLVPIALLIGGACNFAVSVRRLILSGLDSPARALLRPFVDYLLASLVLIDDDTLRQEFATADDFEPAKKFWLKNLTHDKIVARLSNTLTRYGLDGACKQELFDYLQQERQMHSQVIHPGNVGATLGVFDLLALHKPQAG